MRKVLSFSLFLMLGLVASQLLPGLLGPGYSSFKATTDTLLYVCLGFIMINVGREFEIDKSRWRSYTADYFIAMATAIPLQILMIGLRWQMFAIVAIVAVLLAVGWRWQATWDVRQDWKRILGLSVIVCALTQAVYLATKHWYGAENSIHIEVLLPAFVVGMLMRHRHIDTPVERRVATGISFLFMLLVGLSMPMMPWGILVLHVLAVSLLSNLGKLVPLFFYRDRSLSERLALSVGMFTRGEVGAGVIFIALGYNLGGPALIVSVLTLVLNLILTGGFVVWVKRLALKSYTPEKS